MAHVMYAGTLSAMQPKVHNVQGLFNGTCPWLAKGGNIR
jgi:hypothetical protein